MSDSLSNKLSEIHSSMPKPEKSSDELLVEALEKALESTTPERPGCPWDGREKDERRERGIWIPESSE